MAQRSEQDAHDLLIDRIVLGDENAEPWCGPRGAHGFGLQRRIRPGRRDLEAEDAARARLALGVDLAAHGEDEFAADGEAKPCAAEAARR